MAKPNHLSAAYAQQFQDTTIVDAYAYRPPYPDAVFTRLQALMPATPRTVLDVGCGRGELSRPLAPHVARVDAIDWSAAMVARGQQLPGGAHSHLCWQVARAEDAHYAPPYALIIAGASFHWMDWATLCPRFAQMLSPQGMLVIIDQIVDDVPWQSSLQRLIPRFSTNQEFRPYRLVEELVQRGHLRMFGEEQTAPVSFQQSVDDYIESFHSRNGFSRQRMTVEQAAEFDAELKAAIQSHCSDKIVTLRVSGTLQWGRPQ
jgi:SAM-dependent methyltransferase